jgi:hypothetical protein
MLTTAERTGLLQQRQNNPGATDCRIKSCQELAWPYHIPDTPFIFMTMKFSHEQLIEVGSAETVTVRVPQGDTTGHPSLSHTLALPPGNIQVTCAAAACAPRTHII